MRLGGIDFEQQVRKKGKNAMPLYAWVKPAFVKGSPVDHTWVTTYDSGASPYASLHDVQAHGEHYWFCKGSFHQLGVSTKYPNGQILTGPYFPGSKCLVGCDDPKAVGTVFTYGLDGVCHQISNQVLFPTGATVKAARGYKLSSAIYGTYGRKNDEWKIARMQCQVNPIPLRFGYKPVSLLYSRAKYYFPENSEIPFRLELLARQLHDEIDTIGFAAPGPNERIETRVGSLNNQISTFIMAVADEVSDEQIVERLIGVTPREEVNLIDPELFEFPDPQDRADGN
jgi:hypothetical protein